MLGESAASRHIDGPQQTRPLDARIADLAGRQYGVVSRGQLEGMGLGLDGIERRVRRGRLHRLHSGVYAVGHRTLPRRASWLAAVFASGESASLSHRSAAALWGIRPLGSGPIHVTTPRKWRSTASIRRHCSHLPIDEVTSVDGIPVTTVTRTILDFSGESPAHLTESALREAEYLRLHDSLSLHCLLDRYPGRRGVRAVRLGLARCAESPGRTRSRLEERFLSFLDRYRLPRPRLNVWIEAGGERHQVDCLWRRRNAIVELDGWQAHGTRKAFREDRARDRRLRAAGYSVIRIAWAQLDDEPETLAADLKKIITATK
jgi:very-short-patch-repair endonuclease